MTLEAYIRTVDTGDIMAEYRAAAGQRAYRFQVTAGGLLQLGITGSGGADSVISTIPVGDGRLHHVLGRFDNGFADLWIDRVFNNSKAMVTPDIDVVVWGTYLATHSAVAPVYMDIFQDENKWYDRAITDDEIKYNALNYHDPVRNGLVMWFRMEEGQGLALHDYSGNGNDGTIFGADWTPVEKWELRGGADL